MDAVTRERGERTLLWSLLLSSWAPPITGFAAVKSRSATQLADFLRRSIELVALFISYQSFRRGKEATVKEKERSARRAAGFVAAAMAVSAVVLFIIAIIRLKGAPPDGSVGLGLAVSSLGALTNGWFWHRYSALYRQKEDLILGAQRKLYQGKTFADMVVVVALLVVGFFPGRAGTKYFDVAGTLLVAFYLLKNSFQAWPRVRAQEVDLG